MYHCFDDYNTANGFRERTILFNRQTLSLAAEERTNSSPKMQTPFVQKSFAAFMNSHPESAPPSIFQFPDSKLRVP
jgi:hypothetical protein